jgi:hypothetical protein
MLETTVASVTSQTVLVLTDGAAEDDAYNGCPVLIEDAASAFQRATGLVVSDYAGSTKTLTLEAAAGFTVAATDKVVVYPKNAAGGVRGTQVGNFTGTVTGTHVGNLQGSVTGTIAGVGGDAISATAFDTSARALIQTEVEDALTPPFLRAVKGMALGTVGSGSTTTSVVTSSLDPAATVADQFKGKILTFAKDTTTAALRGQSTDITASTTGGSAALTVTALTTAAVSGDTFTIS